MVYQLSYIEWSLGLTVTFACLYYLFMRRYDYFKRLGIKYTKPLPLVGNMLKLVTMKEHFNDIVRNSYEQHSNEKYFGMFHYTTPIIVLRDLNIIKQVMTKDFYNFTDRTSILDESELWIFHSIYNMKGDKWREMRTILSPIFANSNWESMYQRCTNMLIDYIKAKTQDSEIILEDVKELMSTFVIDVVASCAFGLDLSTINDPDNEFCKVTKQVLDIKPFYTILYDVLSNIPILQKVLGVRYTKKKYEDFYKKILINIVEERKKSRIVTKDLINLLMSAVSSGSRDFNEESNEDIGYIGNEDGSLVEPTTRKVWKDEELLAQPLVYLVCGYELTLTLLSFLMHALSINMEVQQKLKEEIDEYNRNTNHMVDLKGIQNLQYMDMVVHETLRLWSPLGNIDRVCTNACVIPPSNSSNKSLKIQKGQIVWIPVHSIHTDPKYYPDPFKFIPERFSKENRANMHPMSFLAFGMGQRCCPGDIFVFAQTKMLLFHLLADFDVLKTSKTEEPLQMKANLHFISPKNPISVKLRRRTDIQTVNR